MLIAAEGWNTNWLLTGEGPERLGAIAETRAGYASHDLRADDLRLVIEAIEEELQAAGRYLEPANRALAYTLAYEILVETNHSLPVAKIAQMALRAVA